MSQCPTGGTRPLPPPFNPDPRGGGAQGGGGQGLCKLERKGHRKQATVTQVRRTHSAQGQQQQQQERRPGRPPDTPPESQGGAPRSGAGKLHASEPLWPRLAGGRCLEGDLLARPLTSDLPRQLAGTRPREAVTKWSHSHSGLWHLQHQDRSLPLYTPSPTRSRPPDKRPAAPGSCLCGGGPLGQAAGWQRRQPSTGAREKSDSTERALRKSQGSFP